MTRFKNMLYDLEFKFVFSHEEILKDFINSYFKYIGEEKEFGFSKIVSENYIMPDKREVKRYFSDINGDMLILESYTSIDDNELLNGGELEFVLVRSHLVNKKCYDENEDRFIRWLRIMSADNLNLMKKYSEGDERMQESIKFLEWYATSELNHGFEDILREKEYIAMQEEKIANAKNFLGMGVPVDIVVRGTGLSLDEVLNIEKQIKNL